MRGDSSERHIPLSGAKNFRDFGGYPTACGGTVKRGVLYRSDRLSQLSAEDFARLEALHIQYVCDLRRPGECRVEPTRWHGGAAPQLLHMPLFDDADPTVTAHLVEAPPVRRDAAATRQIMLGLYRRLVTEQRAMEQYRRIFVLLGQEKGGAILLHCTGGKDRTGVSCALILWALGVADEDILADFMVSQTLYGAQVDFSARASQVFDYGASGDWGPEALRPVFSVEPAYLETALAAVRTQYPSAASFLRQCLRLDDALITAIRHRLIAS